MEVTFWTVAVVVISQAFCVGVGYVWGVTSERMKFKALKRRRGIR